MQKVEYDPVQLIALLRRGRLRLHRLSTRVRAQARPCSDDEMKQQQKLREPRIPTSDSYPAEGQLVGMHTARPF